jgi:hypothetical protein
MKASVSLLTLFLIAAGCTDATTDPTGLTPANSVSAARLGNPPPPPIDAAVTLCTDGGCAVFEGEYMSNGADQTGQLSAAKAAGDGVCFFPGQAFLKIDEQLEPQITSVATSANATIKCSHQRASGGGSVEIGGVVVNFDQVIAFNNSPDCTARCGEFTVRDEDGDVASGVVFEREFYEEVCEEGEGEGGFCEPGGEG